MGWKEIENTMERTGSDKTTGDWQTFANTFAQSRKAGESAFLPKPEDDAEGDFVGKLYRSIKDPLADMEGDSMFVDGDGNIVRESELTGDFVGSNDNLFGAEEERAIEASGDADVGRRFQRAKRRGGRLATPVFFGHSHIANPVASSLKKRIKAQLAATKVVSKALVKKWASAKAGSDTGDRRRSFYKRMKAAINAKGGTISRDKSETAGY
jgi:hypothetical protein